MKFEHVLQIYWTKGFFFGGQLFYTNQTLTSLVNYTPGLSKKFLIQLNQRFELVCLFKSTHTLITDYAAQTKRIIVTPLNVIFSQINTVNNRISDLERLVLIRQYLIKSYKGRCHAIGKPVRGQRTWSNGWTSYKINKTLRSFIYETTLKLKQKQKTEKINYKVVKKKYASKTRKRKTITAVKKIWF